VGDIVYKNNWPVKNVAAAAYTTGLNKGFLRERRSEQSGLQQQV
jgi:hypothetical protein